MRRSAARRGCFAVQENNHMSISGLIRERLHWLLLSQRIRFKLCTKRCTDRRLYIYPNFTSSLALKVALGHLLVATWWFSGREQSSVNTHFSSRVRRHGTSYRAPSATLHPWTVSRRLWKHLRCMRNLTSANFIAACSVSLVLVCGLYGDLESITVLRRLRNCRDIIILLFLLLRICGCSKV